MIWLSACRHGAPGTLGEEIARADFIGSWYISGYTKGSELYDMANNSFTLHLPSFVDDNVLVLNSDSTWTYTEGLTAYENLCNSSGASLTTPRQVLARGTWTFDQLNQVVRFFIADHRGGYIFNYFPFALPGAGPSTAISLIRPAFNADKTLLTVQVQDFLALKSYTRDAKSDAQQLCIDGKARRLDQADNLEDQGFGSARLVKAPSPSPRDKPVPEQILVNHSFSMQGYTVGGLYDKNNNKIDELLPRSIRDNALTLLKKNGQNTWVYVDSGDPYSPCGLNGPASTVRDQILAKGTWTYEEGVLILTVDPNYDVKYLIPYKVSKEGTITISKIQQVPSESLLNQDRITGMLANFFTPKGYKKGQPSSLCKGGQPADLTLPENVEDKAEGGAYLAQGPFKDPEVTEATLEGLEFKIERFTLRNNRPPANAVRNNIEQDKLLPHFFWDDFLILKPHHKFEYNENENMCHPCMDTGKDPATQRLESLSYGTWSFDNQRKTLTIIPDADDPYFVSILPYAKNRGDTIQITHLRKEVQLDTSGQQKLKRIVGELQNFYRPTFYDGTPASLCNGFGEPKGDFYGAQMEGIGGGMISFLKEGPYIKDGVHVVQKACFENTRWSVVSQVLIKRTADAHQGRSIDPLLQFVPGGVLTLKRDAANDSLSWTYSQSITVPKQVTDSGRWKYALSDKSLVLTFISINKEDKVIVIHDVQVDKSGIFTGHYCNNNSEQKNCFDLTMTKIR